MFRWWNALSDEGQNYVLIAGFLIEAYFLFWVLP